MAKFINFKVVGGVTNGSGTQAPQQNGDNLILAKSIINIDPEIAGDGTMQVILTLNLPSGVITCNAICSTSQVDPPNSNAPNSSNYINKVKAAITRAIKSKPGATEVDCILPQDSENDFAPYDPNLQVYWRSFNLPAIPLAPPLTNATLATAVADALALDPTGNTAIPVYGLMSNWNTRQVTSMNSLFIGQTSFNADISNWDVSNVTNFNSTFQNCNSFNQNLNSWNTSSATTMNSMFQDCTNFNSDLNNWDVSGVDDFTRMFWLCTNFNGDVTSWSFSTTIPSISFFQMFQQSGFNRDISGWNTERVGSMTSMLRSTPFNQDISSWDVSNVTIMSFMFADNTAINQDLSSWNVAAVTACGSFSLNAVQWVLPQPNFTACVP